MRLHLQHHGSLARHQFIIVDSSYWPQWRLHLSSHGCTRMRHSYDVGVFSLIQNFMLVYFPNLHLNCCFRVDIYGFRVKSDMPYGQTSQSVTGNLPFITGPSHEGQRTHAVTFRGVYYFSTVWLTKPAKQHHWEYTGDRRPATSGQ